MLRKALFAIAALCLAGIAAAADYKVISRVEPTYPENEAAARIGGTTVLLVTVDNEGRVIDVRVERSSRSLALDRAAIQAVKQWVFDPTSLNGSARLRIPVTFTPPAFSSPLTPELVFQASRSAEYDSYTIAVCSHAATIAGKLAANHPSGKVGILIYGRGGVVGSVMVRSTGSPELDKQVTQKIDKTLRAPAVRPQLPADKQFLSVACELSGTGI